MTIAEYKALKKGAFLRTIDDLEVMAQHAYDIAIAGGFDKDGKPLIKSPRDLFNRKKVEAALLGEIDDRFSKERSEAVEKFKTSKEMAEAILNRRFSGGEDIDGE